MTNVVNLDSSGDTAVDTADVPFTSMQLKDPFPPMRAAMARAARAQLA